MENRKQDIADYIPISCDIIDHIEIFATNKKRIQLVLGEAENLLTFKTYIKTWFTSNKVEYLELKGGFKVRLDKIHEIDGILVRETDCKV